MSVLSILLISAVIAGLVGCNPPQSRVLTVGIVSTQHAWKYKYPPGPKPLPLIGNMHQLPTGQLGKWAQKMAEEHGEMFSILIGGQRWVFLNSSRTIKELLDKRAAVQCSRRELM
jgi:Cytochrome P450